MLRSGYQAIVHSIDWNTSMARYHAPEEGPEFPREGEPPGEPARTPAWARGREGEPPGESALGRLAQMLWQGLLILPFGRPQVYRSEPSELETFGPGDGGVRRPAPNRYPLFGRPGRGFRRPEDLQVGRVDDQVPVVL